MFPSSGAARGGRLLLAAALLSAACALQCGCSRKSAAPGPGLPNVVLVVIDTLRRDHVGAYGGAQPITPNLDAFAKDAVQFQNAYSTAPWTIPSIGGMLTGHYPTVLGIGPRNGVIGAAHPMLPEILAASGYLTGAVVSHRFLSEPFGFARGFASFRNVVPMLGVQSFVSSPRVTEAANGFVDGTAGRPFFLLVHYFDPHFVYLMHDLYDPFPDYGGRLGSPMAMPKLVAHPKLLGADDIRYLRACYQSEVAFTDDALGAFLRHLRERGLYDDAMIVVTADHGEEICHHEDCWIGHGRKLTEDLVHVPLWIKYPKRERGLPRAFDGLFSLVDLMPTIAAYAGARLPEADAAAGRAFDVRHPERGRSAVFAETKRAVDLAMIREGDFKLVLDRRSGDARLYHLPADHPEAWDRETAEDPARAQAMRGAIAEWTTQVESAAQRFGGEARIPDLPKELREQLAAMGYVDNENGGGNAP